MQVMQVAKVNWHYSIYETYPMLFYEKLFSEFLSKSSLHTWAEYKTEFMFNWLWRDLLRTPSLSHVNKTYLRIYRCLINIFGFSFHSGSMTFLVCSYYVFFYSDRGTYLGKSFNKSIWPVNCKCNIRVSSSIREMPRYKCCEWMSLHIICIVFGFLTRKVPNHIQMFYAVRLSSPF